MGRTTLWTMAMCTAVVGSMALSAVADSGSALGLPTTQAAQPDLPMPWLQLDFKAGSLLMRGTLPNAIERDAVLAWARTTYGRGHVTGDLKVGAVANPNWLHVDYLPDLRPARRAMAMLSAQGLAIDGEVSEEADLEALARSTQPARERSLRVVNRVVVD